MWSHDVVVRSVALAADLKVGQYLKIPPRVMFLTQIWGALIGMSMLYKTSISDYNLSIDSGAIVNYGKHTLDLLLDFV